MSKKLDELRVKHTELISAIREAEQEEFESETLPDMEKMIGKTYRYRNSYSCGDKWWLYVVLIGISDDMFQSLQIQKDSNGRVEVCSNFIMHPIDSRYEPISRKEFDESTKPIMSEIAKLLKKKGEVKS